MTDLHCHLESNDISELERILNECKKNNVNRIVISGYDLNSSKHAIDLANKYDMIYATIGFHPDVLNDDNYDISELEKLIDNKKVIGIGEIGLDYYWRKDNKDEQQKLFKEQILLANKYNLPIIVHCREAIEDSYKILKEMHINKFILHCYSGSLEMAREFVKIGGYISIGGVCTFKNAKTIVDVIKNIDLEYILLETDSPYLTPVPYRGTTNYPYYIPYIAEKIAEIKDIKVNSVSDVTDNTFNRIFDL